MHVQDAYQAAMIGLALPGLARKKTASRQYSLSTTATAVALPTASVDTPAVTRTPNFARITFASGNVFVSSDSRTVAVVPTTSVDGAEEVVTGQVLLVANLDRLSLIANGSITVTITWYWI